MAKFGLVIRAALLYIFLLWSSFILHPSSKPTLWCGDLPSGLGAQTRPFNLCARKPWCAFASCCLLVVCVDLGCEGFLCRLPAALLYYELATSHFWLWTINIVIPSGDSNRRSRVTPLMKQALYPKATTAGSRAALFKGQNMCCKVCAVWFEPPKT